MFYIASYLQILGPFLNRPTMVILNLARGGKIDFFCVWMRGLDGARVGKGWAAICRVSWDGVSCAGVGWACVAWAFVAWAWRVMGLCGIGLACHVLSWHGLACYVVV